MYAEAQAGQQRAILFVAVFPVEDFIREGHIARAISEVADSLDTSVIEKKHSYPGQKSYSPELLLTILFYGSATGGTRAGRKMAAANPCHRNHFRCEAACDQYICPGGKPLPYHLLYNNKTCRQQSRLYQAASRQPGRQKAAQATAADR